MKYYDYLSLIEKTVPTFRGSFLREKGVRIWKSSASIDPFKALHNSIKTQTIDLEYHEDMVFNFDGELLNSSKYPTMEDIGLTTSHLLVIELKESSKPWSIKNIAVAAEGKCESCYYVKVLTNPCVCKKVSYCSEEC
jgi:ubiquitin carboxyl-terminal hydrolase 4/11/15